MPDLQPLATDPTSLAGLSKAQLVERLNAITAELRAVTESDGNAALRDLRDTRERLRAVEEQLVAERREHAVGTSDRDLDMFVRTAADGAKSAQWKGAQMLVAAPGGGHAEVWQPGLLDDDAPTVSPWHEELKRLVQARSIVKIACQDQAGARPTPKLDALIRMHLDRAPGELKRIFGGTTGSGGDWQQTLVLPMIAEDLRHPVEAVEDLFETVEMGAKTVTIPFATGTPPAFRYGMPTSDNPADRTASSLDTTSRSMTADGLAVLMQVFDDASEDSILNTMPLLQRFAVQGLRMSIVDAIVNGDTNGQDTLTGWNPRSIFSGSPTFGTSLDHRKSWIGLRARAFDVSATRDGSSDTTYSTDTLKSAKSALKAPHGSMTDLVNLVSDEVYIGKILTDTNVITVEKYGPNASILTGEVGRILGARVVVSDLMTADLAATGLYTGSGSYTSALLFNRARFVRGIRKGVSVEVERRATNGVTYLVVTSRQTFKALDGASDKTVHATYKLS